MGCAIALCPPQSNTRTCCKYTTHTNIHSLTLSLTKYKILICWGKKKRKKKSQNGLVILYILVSNAKKPPKNNKNTKLKKIKEKIVQTGMLYTPTHSPQSDTKNILHNRHPNPFFLSFSHFFFIQVQIFKFYEQKSYYFI